VGDGRLPRCSQVAGGRGSELQVTDTARGAARGAASSARACHGRGRPKGPRSSGSAGGISGGTPRVDWASGSAQLPETVARGSARPSNHPSAGPSARGLPFSCAPPLEPRSLMFRSVLGQGCEPDGGGASDADAPHRQLPESLTVVAGSPKGQGANCLPGARVAGRARSPQGYGGLRGPSEVF